MQIPYNNKYIFLKYLNKTFKTKTSTHGVNFEKVSRTVFKQGCKLNNTIMI